MRAISLILFFLFLGISMSQAQETTPLNSGPAYRSSAEFQAYALSLRNRSEYPDTASLRRHRLAVIAGMAAVCAGSGIITGGTAVAEVVPVLSLIGNLGTDLMLHRTRSVPSYILDAIGGVLGPASDAIDFLASDDDQQQWRQTRARFRFTQRVSDAAFGQRSVCLELRAKVEAIDREIANRNIVPVTPFQIAADNPAPRDVAPVANTQPVIADAGNDRPALQAPGTRPRPVARRPAAPITRPSVQNDSGAPLPMIPRIITDTANQAVQAAGREVGRIVDGIQGSSSDDAGQ